MNATPVHRVLDRVSQLLAAHQLESLSDRELLLAFGCERREAAFAVLVRRHAAMVLNVCRRVLRHEQDAEDAFQAAFLTLARLAGSRSWRDSVAPWLHRVAYHLALRLRRRRAIPSAIAPRPDDSTKDDPLAVVSGRELCAVLDEEMQRLPEACRAALVLCCLEGLTRDEAASRLGWSLGTLKRRLERSRSLLRQRLSRRGFALPAVLAAGLYAEGTSKASVPIELTRSVIGAAMAWTHGAPPAGMSAMVAQLCESAVRGAGVGKLKILTATLLIFCAASMGIGLALQPVPPGTERQAEAPQSPPVGERRKDETPRVDLLGDPLPPGAIARLGSVRLRQSGGVKQLVFAADGKTLFAASDFSGRVWDLRTGRERSRVPLAVSTYHRVALSADGRLAVATPEKPIRFWDLTTAKESRPLGDADCKAAVAVFTPDGKRLATIEVGGKAVILWDLTTGRREAQLTVEGGWRPPLVFSPDGALVALPTPGGASVWEVKSGRKLRGFNLGSKLLPAFSMADAVAFSPDGKKLAIGDPFTPEGGKMQVHVWSIATGERIARWPEPGDPYCLAFTPDGKALACGCRYGTISLREPETGKQLRQINAHTFGVTAIAFSPDGRQLVSGGVDGLIHLWDPASGEERRPYDGPSFYFDWLAFAPDGRSIISAGRDQAAVWEAYTGRIQRLLDDAEPTRNGGKPSLSPDGKTLAAIGGPKSRVHLWDLARGQKHPLDDAAYVSYRTLFAPDGRTLATLAAQVDPPPARGQNPPYVLCLWDVASGRLRRSISLPGMAWCAVFSPDSEFVTAAIEDRRRSYSIQRWRTADGSQQWKRPTSGIDPIYDLALTPDGRTLAVVGSEANVPPVVGVVQLCDAASGELLRRWRGHNHAITSARFSPDGRTLATASADDTVRLWEVSTGRERRRLSGSRCGGGFQHVAFSPDGRLLASVGADTAGLVWDLTGRFCDGHFDKRPLADRELASRWDDLNATDAARAYRAIHVLVGSPDNTAAFLRKHLMAMTPAAEEKRVQTLLADLDSEAFDRRRDAANALARMGPAVEPMLRQALAGKPSLEVRQRIDEVLEKLTQGQLVARRAVEALEMIGTAEARQVLEQVGERIKDTGLGREAADSARRLARGRGR